MVHKEQILKEFGEEVYQNRRRQRLTQQQVAKAVGLSQNAISRMEKAQHEPLFATAVEVAQYLGFSIDALMENTP